MKTTTEDIERALGAFLICLGTTMSAAMKAHIKQAADTMAAEIDNGGEPNVARLTRAFANALDGIPPPSATR